VRIARPAIQIFALATLLAPACRAQLPPVSSTTSTPVPGAGHDYLGGVNETVNPANGSISIRIPVIMPPGRGITLPFSFAYDSNGVNYLSATGTNTQWQTMASVISQAGWSDSIPMVSKSLLTWYTLVDGGPTKIRCQALVNFVFQDVRGNRHNLGLTKYSDPGGTGQCTINSSDWPNGFDGLIVLNGGEGPVSATIGSNWSPYSTPAVTDGDGVGYGFASSGIAGSVTDRNGNTININSTYPVSSYEAFSYVDATGRTVLQDSGFAVSPETVTISGLGAPYTLSWTTLATPSFSTPITTPVTVSFSVACGTPTHPGWTSIQDHAVSTLTLPNGKSFSFTYDPVYGLVDTMTYPTGGQTILRI
jgi:hypothetical protein